MKPDTIRKTLAALPRVTQRFWTWLTGLLPPGALPHHPWTPWQHFVCTFSVFWLAAAVSLVSMQHLLGLAAPSIL